MIPKLIIGVLAAILLVILYRGMQQDEARIDPNAPVDVKKIQAVLQAMHLACDQVVTYTAMGQGHKGISNVYLARCHDGGRYVYYQDQATGRMGAISCAEEARRFGVRCPE
jgi:hypothetical protein